jgi:hypothetical protein
MRALIVILGLALAFLVPAATAGAQDAQAIIKARASVVSVLPVWPGRPPNAAEPEGSGVVMGDGTQVITADHVLGPGPRLTRSWCATATGRSTLPPCSPATGSPILPFGAGQTAHGCRMAGRAGGPGPAGLRHRQCVRSWPVAHLRAGVGNASRRDRFQRGGRFHPDGCGGQSGHVRRCAGRRRRGARGHAVGHLHKAVRRQYRHQFSPFTWV